MEPFDTPLAVHPRSRVFKSNLRHPRTPNRVTGRYYREGYHGFGIVQNARHGISALFVSGLDYYWQIRLETMTTQVCWPFVNGSEFSKWWGTRQRSMRK